MSTIYLKEYPNICKHWLGSCEFPVAIEYFFLFTRRDIFHRILVKIDNVLSVYEMVMSMYLPFVLKILVYLVNWDIPSAFFVVHPDVFEDLEGIAFKGEICLLFRDWKILSEVDHKIKCIYCCPVLILKVLSQTEFLWLDSSVVYFFL